MAGILNRRTLRTFILLFVLVNLIAGSIIGCGRADTEYVHYTNTEFGYSLDYPSDWYLEGLNPNEIAIGPHTDEFSQIQVVASPGAPVLKSLTPEMAAANTEAGLYLFFDVLKCTNLNIFVNEAVSGKWDWKAVFTVTCQGTSLLGAKFIKETPSITYTILIVSPRRTGFAEGWDVIDSFELE